MPASISNHESPTTREASISNHQSRTTNHHPRGISLMEVLISMFVLLIGLVGVAALIPAGRHEIAQGTKLETAAMIGRGAFRDMKVRGYLNPRNWRSQSNGGAGSFPVWDTSDPTLPPFVLPNVTGSNRDRLPVVIDPFGLLANPGNRTNKFPSNWTEDFPATLPTTGQLPPPLLRVAPFEVGIIPAAKAVADQVFRSTNDLLSGVNATNKELPPEPIFVIDRGGAQISVPTSKLNAGTDTILHRSSEGNYSWIATVVPDPFKSPLASQVTVSVVVFYKRDLTSNGTVATAEAWATPNYSATGTGVLQMALSAFADPGVPTGKFAAGVKPGQWIMLAGSRMFPGADHWYYRWYRVLSADARIPSGTGSQSVTLAGPDWPLNANETRVWLFDGIVAVYEKNMMLELD